MNSMMKTFLVCILLLGGGACRAQDDAHMPRPDGNIPLEGIGRWDYITFDGAGNRLFVPHGDRVQVVDLETKKEEGVIKNTPGVHGVALAQEFGVGFTSNGANNTVTAFDLATLETKSVIDVRGQKPDAIMYDAFTKKIFVFDGKSEDVNIIDPATLAIAGVLKLSGAPEAAVSDGAGNIFVNIEDKGTVAEFSVNPLRQINEWPLAPNATPTGIAADLETHRLFVGCRSKALAVVDMTTGRLVASIPIGDRVDGVIFDAQTHLIFTSNGVGTISVIHEDSPDTYTALGDVTTIPGARTMTIDASNRKIYLPVTEKVDGKERFFVLRYDIP